MCEKRIIVCLCVPDMRDDGQAHCLLIESLGGCRAPHAATVLLTGVLRDDGFPSCWAVREKLTHARRKAAHEFLIQLGPAGRFPFSPSCPDLAVSQAFLLGLFYRLFFDQHKSTAR